MYVCLCVYVCMCVRKCLYVSVCMCVCGDVRTRKSYLVGVVEQ